MPLVYSIKCDICDFAEGFSDHVLFAEREDGKEIALPHPLESSLAKELTGMTLDQLGKLKRLCSRAGYLCLSCGTGGYYARRNGGFEGAVFADIPESASLDEELNTPVIITRLPDLRCANCNEDALEIAGGPIPDNPDGCLITLLDFLGLIKPRPLPTRPGHLCPWCHTRHIHWKWDGTS